MRDITTYVPNPSIFHFQEFKSFSCENSENIDIDM
jgi:hypothetical protein